MANAAAEQLQQRRRRSKHTQTHTHTVAHLDLFNASGRIVNASLCVFMSVLYVCLTWLPAGVDVLVLESFVFEKINKQTAP